MTLFIETLAQLGWIEGKNIRFDIRWNDSDPSRIAAQARELIHSKPDVLLAAPTRALIPLQKETRTIPIFLCRFPIRSDKASSIALRGHPATSPDLATWNFPCWGSGYNFSRKFHRKSGVSV